LGVVLGLAAVTACAPKPEPKPETDRAPESEPAPPAAECPMDPIHVEVAPDVEDRHRQAAFWLDRLGPAADEVLLDAAGIARVNEHTQEVDGAWRDVLSDEVGDRAHVAKELADRTTWMRKRIEAGKYAEGKPGTFDAATAIIEAAKDVDELRVLTAETQTFCVPSMDGVFSIVTKPDGETSHDPDFDRNHCSSLHPGELVRVLRRSEDETWWHVNAGHSVGWLHQPAWTPALPTEKARAFRDATPRLFPVQDDVSVGPMKLRLGVSLPILQEGSEGWKVQVPTSKGLEEASAKKSSALRQSPPAFTRRALLELALSQLDAPYGWGGRAGGRDCSRFLFDDFWQFGIELARHSSVQAQLGSESIELGGLDEATKRSRIHEAAARGVVLLYMPGHIMLYLGADEGHDYAVSSLSEYLVPCPGGPDTVYRLDRVAVTNLEVGRGSERTSFIERIERMAVFGPPPG
jgi:cell wall-associated NlpC family hydrolase